MATNEDLVHGWYSTDCGRGTSDILWSCVTTILLSVWTVIHLPVPYCSRREKGQLIAGKPSQTLRNWIIRSGIVTALISIVVPELLTITAIGKLTSAWQIQEKIKSTMESKWTLTHTFFLQMGGFCLESPSGLRRQVEGDHELLSAIPQAGSEKGRACPDWLSALEKVTEDQINHHAKSSPLTKSIACSQALWLMTQVVSRVCQHRAMTLLEVNTSAYAICAFAAYLAWWKKPQSCTLPITILCSQQETLQEPTTQRSIYYKEDSWAEYVWAGQHWLDESLPSANQWTADIIIIAYGKLALCPAIFGAIHVASWNTAFLSDVEKWLWRASALVRCTAGILLVLMVCLEDLSESNSLVLAGLWFILSVLYILARLFMIFEVFQSACATWQRLRRRAVVRVCSSYLGAVE